MDEPEDTKPRKRFPPKCTIFLGSLLAVAIIALITVAVTQNRSTTRNSKYGIVLDAGSSHTNLYVYEWPAEKENDTGVVQQVDVCEVEGPGISAYARDVEKAGVSLHQCMDRAKARVPPEKHQDTPVYLGATAGMRLLSLENKGAAEKVLSSVEKSLRLYPFHYQGARVLSGEEEGAYGWITINYLLGNFKESVWPRFLPRIFSSAGTKGALDLGGASTQITFVPNQEITESQKDTVNFRLYGKDYTVYTHSFLCYGKDQALRLKLAKDVQVTSDGRLEDPCFHSGYEKILDISELLTNPCTAPRMQPPSYTQLQIVGAGNYELCLKSIDRIFNVSNCPYSSCSFNGIFLPPVNGEFGAFSAFYYVMEFLNVTSQPLEQVTERLKTFCSKSWNQVKADFPKVKEKYLSDYCFSGTYITLLLGQRYTFTKEKWSHIQFLKKIGKSDAGWTLGYMLNLTNMIPAEHPYTFPMSHASYISLMAVCSILVVSVLLIVLAIYRKPKCLQKGII
ncbi:ectonucleoside triphosphate diphosphohydrolase 1 [Hemicordylus capensis]|uniref:ectonucleoside triphosphate diphosphohydrolase 1 n=1 Tax=Hemicordylus capensis TaxID=884348 RepID=UPI00230294EC|nr:ectonucleoside triphosphate diphosphohydrolase 1 [Hemicordylus capensis]